VFLLGVMKEESDVGPQTPFSVISQTVTKYGFELGSDPVLTKGFCWSPGFIPGSGHQSPITDHNYAIRPERPTARASRLVPPKIKFTTQ